MITAIIRNKENTLVLELPHSIYDIYEKLRSIGIMQPPKRIPLTDNEDEDIGVKLFSESDFGQHLLLTLHEKNSIADANMLTLVIGAASEDIKEELEQNILYDQYDSMDEVINAVRQMTQDAGPVKAVFFCPLIGNIDEGDGDMFTVGDSYLADSADEIADALNRYTANDENDMAAYGEYTVKQTKGWEGKELLAPFTVFVSEDGRVYRFLINNATFEALIEIVKKDAETGKIIPASGIGFKVRNTDTGEYIVQHINYPTPVDIDTYYTDVTGKLMMPEKLSYGNYEIIEQCTAYGYVLDSAPIAFKVDGSKTVVTVEKHNMPQKGIVNISKSGEVFSSAVETDGVYSLVFADKNLAGATYEITAAEDITTPNLFAPYSEYHSDLSAVNSTLSVTLENLVLTYQTTSSTTVRITVAPKDTAVPVLADMRRTSIYNTGSVEAQTFDNTTVSGRVVLDEIVYSQSQETHSIKIRQQDPTTKLWSLCEIHSFVSRGGARTSVRVQWSEYGVAYDVPTT